MNDGNCIGLTGKIITREDRDYNESIKAWNRAINKHPFIIVYCYTEEDVINAIKWSRENSKEIRVRSGAHSYEGYSTGDDVVVIDVSNINYIDINEEKGYVKIGGGVRNREAYEALGKKGYPFPGGGCPTVGVPGLILGGGWGYSARYLGLASDSLLEAEIINYKGQKLIVNRNQNKDLFWGIMGSGGCNFGVITSMKLKLSKKEGCGSLIYINYPNASYNTILNIITELQNLFKSLDRKINLKTAIYNSVDKGIGVKITGLFYGSSTKAKDILKSLLGITKEVEITIEDKSILECNKWIQDSHPDYEKYKSTGRFLNRDLSDEEIEEIIKIISKPAKGFSYTAVSFYGAGGAISDVDKSATAYYYRDAKFIVGIQSVWEEDIYAEDNKDWVKENFSIINDMTKGSFVNFPLDELDNFEKEYYGDNLDKLRKVKSKYDPLNIFDYPQAIRGKS